MSGAHRVLTALFVFCAVPLALAVVIEGGADAKGSSNIQPPAKARVQVVEDDYNGKKISDPYRWLEDSSDPATQQFMKDQLAYTHALLDSKPQKEKIQGRLAELLKIGAVGTPHVEGDLYFYTRRDPGQNQSVLYVRKTVNGTDRELVNVNTLAADGTIALDWWRVSPDGKYVVYGTSPGGSEISMLHVLDVATGKLLPDQIDRCRASSIAFLPDNSAFYYAKYPRPGDVPADQEMYNRHIFLHKIGTNLDGLKDEMVWGEGRPPREWPSAGISKDGRWLTIHASDGTNNNQLFLKDLKNNGPFVELSQDKDNLWSADLHEGNVYLVTNYEGPKYHLFKIAAEHPARADWKEIIPESRGVLKNVNIVNHQIVAEYEQDANSQVKIFSLDGKPVADVKLPGLGNVTGMGGEADGKELFYGFNSFTVPPTVMRYDMKSGASGVWARISAPFDPSAYEVKQVFFPSKDGTKIPMFIVSKKGTKLTGKNPALLAGYGGFNLSRTPTYYPWLPLWLENGGIYADANMRGGSEYGEEWHRAGMLDKKQNVFDDYIAAAEYLIKEKYTDTPHLAAYGRSNGGLLTGAVLTQRPDLYKAIVCGVPLLDMLRYQKFQIARLWIPEYGTAEDPKQFDFIYAYSPYQHVQEREYPAVLFFTSDGDTRVDPLHARKMTALMQAKAKNGPDKPILLRIEPKAGHGAGKPIGKQIDEWADIFTFLFWQLGVK